MTSKTILFDLGGVIVTLDKQQAIKRFEQIGVADASSRLDSYTQQGIFGDLELGKVSAEEFRRGISLIAGREVSLDDCLYAWLGYVGDLPQRNLDMLKRLRRDGHRVVLVSNTNPFMMSWAQSRQFDGAGNSIDHYFDAIYVSYKLGAMKPDMEFFRKVLASEGVAPGQAIFVDDGPRNVAAAESLGIKSLCPKNGSDWTNDLLGLL